MCGWLQVGKDFLHTCSIGRSVRPCVRPTSAVHVTAGHNALCGSGPAVSPNAEQLLDAMPLDRCRKISADDHRSLLADEQVTGPTRSRYRRNAEITRIFPCLL